MSFRDRVAGGPPVEHPPAPTHFGRWLFDPDDKPGQTRINGCPAGDGDVLAPGITGDWALVRPGDTLPTRGVFFADALPDEQDVTALLQLGRLLRDPEKIKGGWLEWSDTSPLAPSLDKAMEPHPLEGSIEKELEHLVEVCRNPRTHIRVATERVPVARARRIARDAPAWLASHTEDWGHRKIAGIQPRRILAEVREERWDIYENRVVVRLVDDLVAWLRRRIAEVRRILDNMFVRMEEFDASTAGNRHRIERICRLWGEAWDATRGREVPERTLKRIERLLYKVLGLMDSPLYRNVPRRARAPGALRMTNLLSNDDNYRGVARLWHEWSRLPALRVLSARELHDRHQELHRGFDAWCMLVIVRACSQIGLDPTEDGDWQSEIRPGCAIRLDRGFRIEWEEAGAIALVDDDAPEDEARVRLRFVPLIHVLEHAKTPAAVAARAASLVGAVADASHWTVVLHPAVAGEPPHDALAGIGNPPAPGTTGAIDFIRVSPFSLDSVERVSRAIRWATLAPRMLAYPPTLPSRPSAIPQLCTGDSSWWADREGSPPAVVRPLYPHEESELNLEGRLADARARHAGSTRKRQEVQDKLRQVRGDRRRMAGLNRRRGELLKQVGDSEDDVKRLEDFKRDFERARHDIAALATCPVCGDAEAEFAARDNGCFAAYCRSSGCGSQWELRHDPDTQSRIPVFLPGGADLDTWLGGTTPRWVRVDNVLGCDVLAVPAVRDGGDVGFLPPRTERHGDSLRVPDTGEG